MVFSLGYNMHLIFNLLFKQKDMDIILSGNKEYNKNDKIVSKQFNIKIKPHCLDTY
jgi:hypothetical protein